MRRLAALLACIVTPAFAADEPVTVLRGASAPPPPAAVEPAPPQVVQPVVLYRDVVYLPTFYFPPVIVRHARASSAR